jgi:PIN domain nuclease of toxin-antitoxin system
MNLLLDSNTIYFAYYNRSRLSRSVVRLLESSNNRLFVSYFTMLELYIKHNKGKLGFGSGLDLKSAVDQMDVTVIAPVEADYVQFSVFDPANTDPFDNLIVGIAIREELVLLTSDSKILDLKIASLKTLEA